MKKIKKYQLVNYIIEQAKKLYKTEILKEEKKFVENKMALLEGRSYPVTFDYTDYSSGTPEGEKNYMVTCNMILGHPGSMYRSNGDPGDAPEPNEVEIVQVIDLDTEVAIDIDSLAPEVIQGIVDKAESQEDGGMNEPDYDDLDEVTDANVDAVTYKDFKNKFNIVGSGPGGKVLYTDTDKAMPNFSNQELYNFALLLANRHIGKRLPGMTWDDLSDTNSLWDYIDGVGGSMELDKAAFQAVKDRIGAEDGGADLFEGNKKKI